MNINHSVFHTPLLNWRFSPLIIVASLHLSFLRKRTELEVSSSLTSDYPIKLQ